MLGTAVPGRHLRGSLARCLVQAQVLGGLCLVFVFAQRFVRGTHLLDRSFLFFGLLEQSHDSSCGCVRSVRSAPVGSQTRPTTIGAVLSAFLAPLVLGHASSPSCLTWWLRLCGSERIPVPWTRRNRRSSPSTEHGCRGPGECY